MSTRVDKAQAAQSGGVHRSVLEYRGFRYLNISLVLMIGSIVAYVLHQPHLGVPNGGTWLGYTLGGIGLALILWLMWFGVRKRRYGQGKWLLEEWLSAHIYLGLSLIVVATLHSGFQFGWNVHTLAWSLMMVVILSGVVGLIFYVRVPELMTANRKGRSLNDLFAEAADLDSQLVQKAMPLGDAINDLVQDSVEGSKVGGSWRTQLSGSSGKCPTDKAVVAVSAMAESAHVEDVAALQTVLQLLARKQDLLRRARRDVRYKALMDIWLFVHVPLSFALLASLAAHVIAVFFYW